MKGVFTLGDVAAVCRMSYATVARSCDRKVLAAYTLPGSRHRRVTRAELVRYLRDSGMPAWWIDRPEPRTRTRRSCNVR